MYLGIDIGGTKTLIALFSRRGMILKKIKFRTAQGSRTFLDDLVANLGEFKKYKVKSVAVAIPGVVQKNYTVKFGNRDWKEIDIFTPIKELFDCPIYFENDASLGALYEGYRLPGWTIFLTFSTGIGGGIVEKNRITEESGGFEPGHWQYEYAGKASEWEDIAAASALEKVFHVDYATDLRRKEQLEEVAKRVYLGLPDVKERYHPDTIILGGPLGKIFRLYVKYLPNDLDVRLKRPKRPTESVIYGCYILAKQKERE